MENDATVRDLLDGEEPMSFQNFVHLKKTVFPKVAPREFKSVPGKCPVCERLLAKSKGLLRRATCTCVLYLSVMPRAHAECTLRSDRIMIKRFRLFHRNKFMGEKLLYYGRQMEALASGGKVCVASAISMSCNVSCSSHQ
jgi:hypothetical protein